ncbi:uncharacterized protein HMPREF1541_08881 [Cyphellophora europaea CBS 101466]|uniref:Nucleoporin Nup120/160-domain-containing protein n=1 Tax=Cyphellophora europaea (strain CBS 101466) TaxID=1220924 RepID=W2RLL4_CYPE1|nr:uncharacterized protein HMPREF1541_08881 [Cyphellophora europaea CBS 101466]ETN36603.1 hypothetical protein HMPREF1541_08881 [Cyphellophora europaea CBS 101466]
MLNLYTEVAFQAVSPAAPSIHEIPRKNGSFNDKIPNRRENSYTRDENEYSAQHLSSDGSVYFRSNPDVTPRSCLWTVSRNARVLQIRPADLARNERDTKEAYLTLQFAFQDPIREHTVALTDSDHDDDLHAFVCTTKEEIYHLAIPSSAFKTRDMLDADTKQWCYAIENSLLSINHVFRLHAQSPFELFVCFTSGSIQRLHRKADGRRWEAVNYSEKSSFLGLFAGGSSRKIEYGSTVVDSRAAQAMQASPDSNYLYTVCLNHQLRVRHIPTGKLVVAKDLLDRDEDNQDRTLSAFDRGHLQYLHGGPELRNSMLVTFSPREGGQFKFWDVKGGLTGDPSVEDRYPGTKLTPPDPDPTGNTVWSLIGFRLVPLGGLDARGSAQLWVLWRNNNYHKLFSVQFEFDDIERDWAEHNWVASTSYSRAQRVPDVISSGSEDATSVWLEYLLLPGRYPADVLETALSVYTSTTVGPSQKSAPLKVRLCSAIASNAYPKKNDKGAMNFDLFAHDIDQAWRSFHRAVEKINDMRQAPLNLAYDEMSNLPLIAMTDQVAVVRECDRLELVAQNETAELERLESVCSSRWPHRQIVPEERGLPYQDLAQVLHSAQIFVDEFPTELVQDLETVVADLLFVTQEKSLSSRVYDLYDEVNFGQAVSNDTFDRLERNFKDLGGLNTFNNELVLAAVDLLPEPSPRNKDDMLLVSSIFGLDSLSVSIREYLSLTRDMLWNLLVLTIFIEGEFCQDGERIPGFDAAELFSTIGPILKTVDRNIWLADHSRSVPLQVTNTQTSSGASDLQTVSFLQDRFLGAVKPRSDGSKPRSYLLTALLHEAVEFISSDDPGYNNGTVMLQCDMLQRGEVPLATEFSRFTPQTPWAIYIKGRLAIAKQQYDQAEQYFRQAAYGLACGRALGDLHQLSFGYITTLEIDSFNNGLPRYFQHVLNLFDTAKAHAHSVHFARLALKALTPDQKLPLATFRTELLSRLFTAEMKLSRYQAAFSTLAQFSDVALQKASTATLITAILDPEKAMTSVSDSVATLQSMPWSLHPNLAKQLDAQLNTLAKKQKSISAHNKRSDAPDAGVDYLKVVHAMRLTQGDYRGAVAALYDRLRLVQRQGRLRSDPEAIVLRHALLSLINVMTCVPSDEAYILAEADDERNRENGAEVSGPRKKRRIIITLADLRREYQRVLDRCARVERGDFGFSDGEDSDEDMMDGTSRLELTIMKD